jgi:photosynthetic reaction center L subunit
VEICRKLGMGYHVPVAFGFAILAYVTLVVDPPGAAGRLGHGFPYGICSHLDWVSQRRLPVPALPLQPGAHARRSRFFFTTTLALAHARRPGAVGHQPGQGRSGEDRRSTRTPSSATSSATRSARWASTASGLFLALAAVFFSAVCIVISGPFWTRGWPEWWSWWLDLPIWT